MSRPIDDRRARVLTGLLLAVVFIAGGLTGAVTVTSLSAEGTETAASTSADGPLSGLDLTTEQRAAIDAILARYQPAADSLVQQSIANLRSLMSDADSAVRTILTPAQLEGYDENLSRQPRIRAVRRTVGPDGTVVDTIR